MQRTAHEYHTVSDTDIHFLLKYSEKKRKKPVYEKEKIKSRSWNILKHIHITEELQGLCMFSSVDTKFVH